MLIKIQVVRAIKKCIHSFVKLQFIVHQSTSICAIQNLISINNVNMIILQFRSTAITVDGWRSRRTTFVILLKFFVIFILNIIFMNLKKSIAKMKNPYFANHSPFVSFSVSICKLSEYFFYPSSPLDGTNHPWPFQIHGVCLRSYWPVTHQVPIPNANELTTTYLENAFTKKNLFYLYIIAWNTDHIIRNTIEPQFVHDSTKDLAILDPIIKILIFRSFL